MKKLGYKLAAGAVSAAMLAATMAPPVFAGTLEIVGNGNKSNNSINTEEDCTSIASQQNSTEVHVGVSASSNTGGNDANKNTGSDVDVETGNANTDARVAVHDGGNVLDAPDCCECFEDGESTSSILRNGNKSRNRIRRTRSSLTVAAQKNTTKVGVWARLRSNTGGNDANKNTGDDNDVDITTGRARSFFDVFVTSGLNRLR